MKTAISLPDDLFESAEALARRLGMTRSGLFAAALTEFVAKHRTSRVTERLDAVYGAEPQSADALLHRAARRRVSESEW
jgi:metal-responsive CopG/Arc/MetJ family transcriptional regulator